jgi:RNA polymerase sigma factor (sigma-70 family)
MADARGVTSGGRSGLGQSGEGMAWRQEQQHMVDRRRRDAGDTQEGSPMRWPDRATLYDLVHRAQQHERRALDALLDLLRPSLLAYFMQYVPDVDAEDLAQMALLRIARAVHRIALDHVQYYTMTIARNLVRTQFRRRARDARRTAPAEWADELASDVRTDAIVERAELVDAIRRATLTRLSPALRAVVLALLEGDTLVDVARREGVTRTTVRTRLFRAREVLRPLMGPYLDPLAGDREAARGAPRARGSAPPARRRTRKRRDDAA